MITRVICLAGVLFLGAVAPASAQVPLYVASFDPTATEDSVANALGSVGVIQNITRLTPNDASYGIAVFRIFFGEEGGRIQAVRRSAQSGLLSFAPAEVDDCQLDLTQRTDAVAKKAQAANIAGVGAVAAAVLFRQLQDKADASQQAYLLAEQALQDAIKAEQAASDAARTAHELVHTLQQRYDETGVVARQSPTRAHIVNHIKSGALYFRAIQAANTADANLQAATDAKTLQSLSAKTEEQTSIADRAAADKAGADASQAQAAATQAWQEVGLAVNAEIVDAADQVAQDAADIASALRNGVKTVGAPKTSFAGKLSARAVAALDEVEAAAENAAELAEIDANNALAIADAARKLPPIPHSDNEADAAKLPQMQVIQEIENAGLANTVNGFVLAAGAVGGSPLNAAPVRVAIILAGDCTSPECRDLAAPVLAELSASQLDSLQATAQLSSRQFNTLSNASRSINDAKKSLLNIIR